MKFFLILMILTSTALACPVSSSALLKMRVARLLPSSKSNSWLSATQLTPVANITEEEFLSIIDRVKEVYAPVFEREKKILEFEPVWDTNDRNAFSSFLNKSISVIRVLGGLARMPSMTKDGFLLALCHEVGHHLGGYPKFSNLKWASAEGQADYFATSKCMREVLKNDLENTSFETVDLPPDVKANCRKQYPTKDQALICLRVAKITEGTIKDLYGIKNLPVDPVISLSGHDPLVVKKTNLEYPSIQCRVETFLSGSLCATDPEALLDDRDENVGTCTKKNGNSEGLRPSCWFSPKKKSIW